MKLNMHMHTHIGMNIRIVYTYSCSIFYVNIEHEYVYRFTVCVCVDVYRIHLPSHSIRTVNMLTDKIINISDIYYAIRSVCSMLKIVYSSAPFGYSQQTIMPLDRRNTSSILLFRCPISVMLPNICGKEIESVTFFWSAIPLLFFVA